jgi:hypothetical protein
VRLILGTRFSVRLQLFRPEQIADPLDRLGRRRLDLLELVGDSELLPLEPAQSFCVRGVDGTRNDSFPS